LAVCISQRKGEKKSPVGHAQAVRDLGLEGDAHAGTDRQVSLLCMSSIEKIRCQGLVLSAGDFAENITVGGLEAGDFHPGLLIELNGADGPLLQVTQVGKECHTGCAIRQQVGDCVMPREGVFARVLRGGRISAGDTMELVRQDD
jgi:MOSC domain-containing protein YiiM